MKKYSSLPFLILLSACFGCQSKSTKVVQPDAATSAATNFGDTSGMVQKDAVSISNDSIVNKKNDTSRKVYK